MSSDMLSERNMPLFEGNTRLLVVPAGLAFLLSMKYFPFKLSSLRSGARMSEDDLRRLASSSLLVFMQFVNVIANILLFSFVNGNAVEGSSALTLDTPLDFTQSGPRALMLTFLATTVSTVAAQVEVGRILYNVFGRKLWLHVINIPLIIGAFVYSIAVIYFCLGEAHPTLEYYLSLVTTSQYLYGISDGLVFTLILYHFFRHGGRDERTKKLLLVSAVWYLIFQWAKRCVLVSDRWSEMWENSERLDWVWRFAIYEFVGNAYVIYFFLMVRHDNGSDRAKTAEANDVERGEDEGINLQELKDNNA